MRLLWLMSMSEHDRIGWRRCVLWFFEVRTNWKLSVVESFQDWTLILAVTGGSIRMEMAG